MKRIIINLLIVSTSLCQSTYLKAQSGYLNNIQITPDTATICIGDSVQLNVNLGNVMPSPCSPSSDLNCVGPSLQNTVGTTMGTSTPSSEPTPYSNFYANAKHQFLFKANELSNMGISAGKITEIAWEITSLNGTQSVYNDYQIKIGCTSLDSLIDFEPGLYQVYGGSPVVNYPVVLGWNVHVLDTTFEWDGISNLIVEVCYNRDSIGTWTSNASVPFTTTTFKSCSYYRTDSQDACPLTSTTLTSYNRPVTKFTTCTSYIDTNTYSYSWTPSQGLADTTIKNPMASPSATGQYFVTVMDSLGNTGIDSILITVDICTFVDQNGDPFDINIFPNPGNGEFIISKPVGLDETITIELVNTIGETILQKEISQNQNTTKISISDQSNGIYILHLTIGKKKFVRKIIKN